MKTLRNPGKTLRNPGKTLRTAASFLLASMTTIAVLGSAASPVDARALDDSTPATTEKIVRTMAAPWIRSAPDTLDEPGS